VTIAGGCFLSRSVPDGCLVGGNPGRVVLRRYDNSYLFGASDAEVDNDCFVFPEEQQAAEKAAVPPDSQDN